MLQDKCILITGATGTIGKALFQHVFQKKIKHVVLLDNAETPLYDFEQEIKMTYGVITNVSFVLCSVTNKAKLNHVFNQFKPNVVFHAAAYKHVPLVEKHPVSAVMTNIFGTRFLAEVAIKNNTEYFVFISTDKAVSPTSIMGATKLIGEKYLLACNDNPEIKTSFVVNRFGNVYESSGSVVPLFKKQIDKGGPVTVTHKEATRFFMSVSEAIELVYESLKISKGLGEVFVFDMGKPVRILDIAEKTIVEAGYKPYEEIAIEYLGLRSGEKLHEQLVESNGELLNTSHASIKSVKATSGINYQEISLLLNKLYEYALNHNVVGVASLISEILPDFNTNNLKFKIMQDD